MLSDVRRHDRIALGRVIDHLDDPLRLQFRIGVDERQRLLRLPLLHLLAPRICFIVVNRRSISQLKCRLNIAHNRNVCRHIFANLGRVDVNMHNLRLRGETIQLHRYAVIEAGADVD